jgi:hypothetical protein
MKKFAPLKRNSILINIQKWWLCMLNAGNLSLTLGLTQVRLKLGEVLAHCTRLFHKKPHR